MTVPSGRAASGARSVLRAAFCGVFAIVGLVAGGCGNSTYSYGTVIVTVSADPGPFTAYVADLAAITLIRSDGSGYGLSFSTGYGKTVDFTKLSDTTEVFGAPAIVENTFTSAAITVNYGSGANYIAAQIFVDVGGQSQAATVIDSTAATAGSITYTVKFDPAHPLVVKKGTPTSLNLHFDMSASAFVDTTSSPPKVTVRPFLTASTQPLTNKTLRTRGEFVSADKGASNFTVNSVAFFDSPSYTNAPQGAIQVQTTDQTTYNVNGSQYQGADGLAALSTLPINTIITSYGSFTDVTQQKPVFTATEVYAGIATENVLAARVTGTVASRTGNTLHIHNAELIATNNLTSGAYSIATPTGVLVRFFNDLVVTVDDQTRVTVDRQTTVPSSLQLISVGQQVELEGKLNVDSAGTSSVDATGVNAGFVRLTPTTAWGNLSASSVVNLLSLGGVEPAALTFAGTGSTTANDADPAAYEINTGTVDMSAITGTPLLRIDGTVTSFGAAPPDFNATAVTPDSQTDQVLTIEWLNGTTGPFLNATSAGLVPNLTDPNLGTAHWVQSGPLYIQTTANTTDLTNPMVTPTIVADTNITGQFTIGNSASTTGLAVYHSFDSYLTQILGVLNGTNKVLKLVAVGKYDAANKIFTAYRIDILQFP
jgi:hypothetical protein